MKKKIVILLLIIITTVLITSCGYVEVKCQITNTNVVYMGMKIDIPTDDLEQEDIDMILDTINNLEEHWSKSGMITELEVFKDDIVLVGYYREQTQSKQQAYEKLLSFMTSDASPFVDIESGYDTSYFNDKLYIKAQMDFSSIIDMIEFEDLQASQHTKAVEALNNMSGKLMFDFPGYMLDYTGKVVDNMVEQDISLTEPTEISLSTSISNKNNITEYEAVQEKSKKQENDIKFFRIIIGFSIGLILLLSVLLAISVIGFRRDQQKDKK